MVANTPEMQKWIKEANESEFRTYLINQIDKNNTVILNGEKKKKLTVQQALADLYEVLQWLFDLHRAIGLLKKYKKISIAIVILVGGGGLTGIISTGLKIWNVF